MARPVLTMMSVLAGAQVVVAGAGLSDVIGAKAAWIAGIVVAAAQTGIAFYVQGQIAPYSSVARQRLGDGRIVLGPAATPVMAGDANVGEPAIVELKQQTIGGI